MGYLFEPVGPSTCLSIEASCDKVYNAYAEFPIWRTLSLSLSWREVFRSFSDLMSYDMLRVMWKPCGGVIPHIATSILWTIDTIQQCIGIARLKNI